MRAYVGTCIIGSFAFDRDGNVIEKRLFPKDPGKVAKKLKTVRKGELVPEEKEIADALKTRGFKEIVWSRKASVPGISCIEEKDNLADRKLASEFRRLALEFRWSNTQADINAFLSSVNVELTREEMKKEKPDRILMRVVSVIDELDKEINTLTEMLREWYGLYFPEAAKRIGSNEKFLKAVALYGFRESFEDPQLAEAAKKTSGMSFSEEDVKEVQGFAESVLNLIERRERLAKYLEKTADIAVPNLSAVAGPMLAARLLNLAGGLEKISKMPSSTIQLLGAEKALFRHLRGEGKAPKYGVLFGHPLIQQAPKERKGKVARLVAAKLSIAARMDAFSDKNEGERLRKELEEYVKKVGDKKI